MVEFIIGFVLLLVVLLIIGFFVKRKYYAEVDRFESWKIEIMNRPVLDEVVKIKQLKMVGQAEEFFEDWRKTWDRIVTEQLPNVEEWLYDAEDYVTKYRIKKAKSIFTRIENTLKDAEMKIEEMVDQLNELLSSEEKNREEIGQIQELYKSLRKSLLAHRHAFGKASEPLEQSLAQIGEKFTEFELATESGNYLDAREILTATNENLHEINDRMETIPFLLNECKHELPNQIKVLKDGLKEMKEQGYSLEHINVEKELSKIEKQLNAYVDFIEKAEIAEVVAGIEELREQIDSMFELLEIEVESRQYVQDNQKKVSRSLNTIESMYDQLKEEVANVQLSYQLTSEDEELLNKIADWIEHLRKTVALLSVNGNQSAYSAIKDKLVAMSEEIAEVEEMQIEFANMLKALRKDEINARAKMQELKRKIQETNRLVTKSNIPGLPSSLEILFVEAAESLEECMKYLEQKPLLMLAVQKSLAQAEERVESLSSQVEEMIENVYLIEKIIQYGNRYRSRNHLVNEKLTVAENAFRRFDYNLALEEAASAVESVEPGALKKIENILNNN
ncbi:septation ring formation regulator EzrA [Bacillus kwashiorkori]|uniref:septation ring formation regulator EzrA n=1 Tax=Bacillus kwashiorkori TaxID=1522318 RepID=UPI0007857121|nr:septation ring formation regulator EzrA [Bacillus kwashiorkori]